MREAVADGLSHACTGERAADADAVALVRAFLDGFRRGLERARVPRAEARALVRAALRAHSGICPRCGSTLYRLDAQRTVTARQLAERLERASEREKGTNDD